ncbi:MAG: ABC transporter permease [Selenomonadaceae bacterium]|nr:ABC transporter permease [Selenomonadaceae bacterium]
MNLRDVATVFWRDWIVLKRRLTKFIFSRMVAPLLCLTAFGWGIGRNIQLDSGSYLDFIVPGIMALNSMNLGFHSIITVHAERVYHKNLEEYSLSPISAESFLTGKILGAVLKSLISSVIIILCAEIFGANIFLSPNLFLVLILNSIIFAEIGFYAAMKLSSYEEMAQVNTYILLPMSFLCGTFFKTATLPSAVRFLVECLPLTHASQLLRNLTSGGGILFESLLILTAYAAAGFFLSLHALKNCQED